MSPTLAALERQLEGAEELFAKLTMEEQFWAARQPFLESRGYVLRPRYHPDWVPSWKGKPRGEVFKAEDGYSLPVSYHDVPSRLQVADRDHGVL